MQGHDVPGFSTYPDVLHAAMQKAALDAELVAIYTGIC
jgi:hypothetical protein